MELYRCPNCQHWRCRDCEDNWRLQLRCCQCGEVAKAVQCNGIYMGKAKGRPHDLEHSPRLGTGRPPSASKPIVERLVQFLERYGIPLNAFSRHTTISFWAIRQARIKGGRLWQRRITPQRRDLVWIDPPYKPRCAIKLSHCHGGLLPGSCHRRWSECILSGKDWEAIERVHKG
jgi:hypothetical protein